MLKVGSSPNLETTAMTQELNPIHHDLAPHAKWRVSLERRIRRQLLFPNKLAVVSHPHLFGLNFESVLVDFE